MHFEHWYVFGQAAVPRLWALLTDGEPYVPVSGSYNAWASTDMNASTSMLYPFLSLPASSEGARRQPPGPSNARDCFWKFSVV